MRALYVSFASIVLAGMVTQDKASAGGNNTSAGGARHTGAHQSMPTRTTPTTAPHSSQSVVVRQTPASPPAQPSVADMLRNSPKVTDNISASPKVSGPTIEQARQPLLRHPPGERRENPAGDLPHPSESGFPRSPNMAPPGFPGSNVMPGPGTR